MNVVHFFLSQVPLFSLLCPYLGLNPYEIQGKLDVNKGYFTWGWLHCVHFDDSWKNTSKTVKPACSIRGNCWAPCSSSPQKMSKGFPLNPFCEAYGQWTCLWYKMTMYLMGNQKKEPQMKNICNTTTLSEPFACCFKPSKGRCGGKKGKPDLFSCTGRSGWEKCVERIWKWRKWIGQFD